MRDLYPTFIGDLFSCDQLLESMLSRKVLLLHLVVNSCRPLSTQMGNALDLKLHLVLNILI